MSGPEKSGSEIVIAFSEAADGAPDLPALSSASIYRYIPLARNGDFRNRFVAAAGSC
jgi:hypothetical protein